MSEVTTDILSKFCHGFMVKCVTLMLNKILRLCFLLFDCFVCCQNVTCLKRFTSYGHYAVEVEDILTNRLVIVSYMKCDCSYSCVLNGLGNISKFRQFLLSLNWNYAKNSLDIMYLNILSILVEQWCVNCRGVFYQGYRCQSTYNSLFNFVRKRINFVESWTVADVWSTRIHH